MTNQIDLSYKLRAQMSQYLGKLSLPKTALRFVREALYGIQSRQSTHLSQIARSLNEDIPLIKTENRLCRQLARDGLDKSLTDYVIEQSKDRISDDTLLIIDPSDITKKYAQKMQYQAGVWDGSRGTTGKGYHLCCIVGAKINSHEIVPLVNNLWSQHAPDFDSENAHILRAVDQVVAGVGQRGIYVMDRGGDRSRIYEPLLQRELRFIIRMIGNRNIIHRGKTLLSKDLAEKITCTYQCTIVKEKADAAQEIIDLKLGAAPVKLPGHRAPLYLAVIHGFGEKPLMLLTTEKINGKKKLQWVLDAYLSRWRIEDTLRFAKQSYNIEDIRLLTYARLQNMMALVLLAMSFSMTRLNGTTKLEVLCKHALQAAKRLFGIPDFRYYAIADGIKDILATLKSPPFKNINSKTTQDNQLTLISLDTS